MHLPLIVTLVIALPLDQILQVVVTHSAIQYRLSLILLLAVDESWGWGWHRSSTRDGIRKHGDSLTTGKPGWRQRKWGGELDGMCHGRHKLQ
jgi:hypothetical protein